ncbi:MAG: hypothetical protein LAP38_23380 [Acidobacteriia bacterium]|nr:hypothetical protein [Terriglobia bacterium]
MRLAFLLFLIAASALPATLTITPPVIFDCQNGLGVAQLNWAGATTPVEIRLNQPDGPEMTSLSDSPGSAATGPWVSDGLKFFLVDQSGAVLASAIARVSCGGTVRTIDPGLQGGSYFPLQLGNTWIYRSNSRLITGTYVVRSINATETIAGKTYFVLTQGSDVVAKLRGDDNGVIWMAAGDGEQVYLDPKSASVQKTSYSGLLGDFSDALIASGFVNSLDFDTSTFVRGIGLARLTEDMVSGSSGGFAQSLELVEVRMPGVRFSVPAPAINLSIETTDLDLTAKLVANCALPCYFTACGLGGPQPDPAGTYRPCAQARIEAVASPGAEVQLQLIDGSGAAVFTTSASADARGSSLSYVRVPMYTALQPTSSNFTLLPAGQYRLTGRVLNAGKEVAASSLSVQVR